MIVFVVLWCLDGLRGWVWLLYVRMSLLTCLCVICCSVRDVVCVWRFSGLCGLVFVGCCCMIAVVGVVFGGFACLGMVV